jgi:hypothetical protein
MVLARIVRLIPVFAGQDDGCRVVQGGRRCGVRGARVNAAVPEVGAVVSEQSGRELDDMTDGLGGARLMVRRSMRGRDGSRHTV